VRVTKLFILGLQQEKILTNTGRVLPGYDTV